MAQAAGFAGPAAEEGRDITPSVMALVVAHEPGGWFEDTLESLATQNYPRLEVTVVDAAGEETLADRVHAYLPDASLIDASDTSGFSGAANAFLDTELNPLFLLICHDDVELERDVVRELVLESLRSNAGIVGPKLVDWHNRDQLQHVAYMVDRLAGAQDIVDPGELDQEQYDAVSDVFAVPSACLLIRTDLFRSIGGFDPKIPFYGEDVDLCFRAQIAGARVIVVPDARVGHREALTSRKVVGAEQRWRPRHQLRTLLVTSSRLGLSYLLPLALVVSLGASASALVRRRFGRFRAIWGAWLWNGRRLREIRLRRKEVKATQQASYADVHAQQHRQSIRLGAVLRSGDQDSTAQTSVRELATAIRTSAAPTEALGRVTAFGWALVAAFVLFGSRALIFQGLPAVGDFVPFGDSATGLISDWWSGWRERDLGSSGASLPASGMLGLLGLVTGGALGLVRTLWVLFPIVIGLVGAWRLLGPSGSRRAQVAALVVYAMIPLPWAALATASIAGLYAYGLAPWLLRAFLDAQLAFSGGRFGGQVASNNAASESGGKPSWRSALRLAGVVGTAAGMAAIFDPSATLTGPLLLAGLIVACLFNGTYRGLLRLLSVALLALPLVALFALPLVVDMISSGPTWSFFSQGRSGSASNMTLLEVLSFQIGPQEPSVLIWGFALVMATPLALGRLWRMDLAVCGWCVAIVGWGIAWVAAYGWLPFGTPDTGVLLAGAAAGVALSCGACVLAFEHDLASARFGWRQALLPIVALAAVAGTIGGLAKAETGRWEMPRGDFSNVISYPDPLEDGSYRVLWIASPDNVFGNGRHLVADLAWIASVDGPPRLSDVYPGVDPGSAELVTQTLRRAIEGSSVRTGRELGGLGVRFVVLLNRLAPAPFSEAEEANPALEAASAALASQLDLRRIEGANSALEIYENSEWISLRSAVLEGFDDSIADIGDLAAHPIEGHFGILSGRGATLTGAVPDHVLVAQTADVGWRLEVDGERAPERGSLGYATVYTPASGGDGELIYVTPLWRRAVLVIQVLALLLVMANFIIRPTSGKRR